YRESGSRNWRRLSRSTDTSGDLGSKRRSPEPSLRRCQQRLHSIATPLGPPRVGDRQSPFKDQLLSADRAFHREVCKSEVCAAGFEAANEAALLQQSRDRVKPYRLSLRYNPRGCLLLAFLNHCRSSRSRSYNASRLYSSPMYSDARIVNASIVSVGF